MHETACWPRRRFSTTTVTLQTRNITCTATAARHLAVHFGPGTRHFVIPSDPVVYRFCRLVPVNLGKQIQSDEALDD